MEKEKLIYKSEYTGDNEVELDIQTYHNNGRIFIGLITNEDGYPEPFGGCNCQYRCTGTGLLWIFGYKQPFQCREFHS